MLRTLTRKCFYTLASFTMVFTSNPIVHADDTEIYFTGGGQDAAVRPNVLFILDTSGSMTSTVSGTGGQKRVDVMKDAVKQVLDDVADINVGLMRFTNNDGGPILFPVTYVEENVFNVVGETASASTLTYSTTIDDGFNDGYMNDDDADKMYLSESSVPVDTLAGGVTTLPSSSSFSLTVTGGSRDAEEEVGGSDNGDVDDDSSDLDLRPDTMVAVRFDVDAGIPQNAKITNAYVQFQVQAKKTTTTNVTIYAEDSNDANGFTECNNSCDDISSRNRTNGKNTDGTTDIIDYSVSPNVVSTGSVAWNGVAALNKKKKLNTPSIAGLVQEIVSRGCTVAPPTANANCTYNDTGGDMVFIFETSTGNRDLYSRNDSSSRAPKLFVEYETTTTAAVTNEVTAGLRFENIRIPQGATITDARLTFTPTSTVTTSANKWTITAEAADNSAEFSTTAGNFLAATRPRTTGVDWNTGTNNWDAGVAVQSANIKDALQAVVSRTGWCGGNAVSLFIKDSSSNPRAFESFESSAADAARLTYTYTSSSGCFENNETSQVGTGNDDAEQAGTVVYTIDSDLNLGNATDAGSAQTVGIRFQEIDGPQGATIVEAEIQFYAQGTSSGAASFTIKGIDEDDLSTFSATTDDITGRNLTTASVAWVAEDWTTTGERYDTADISTIVKEIVDRTNWASGNNMGFVIEPGTGERIADSYNGDPARGPRLRIRYQDSIATPFKSVRESLIEIIDDLPASGATPIQETMYEAARYWRGESMEYGDTRDGSRTSRISHPASYCTASGSCRGAKENDTGTTPTDGFGVYTPSGCNMASNPNDSDCAAQVIEHDSSSSEAMYISPFSSTLTCANNYQVLLTDGSANSGNDESPEIVSMIPKSSCYNNNSSFKTSSDASKTYGSSEDCTVDLAEFLATTDQSTATVGANLANDQIVKTYTIGFNLDSTSATQFIKDIANVGEGGFYEASTAGQLVDVFTTILTDVKSDPTSFVSPSLATNAFNRLLSRDEVYFGLFTPALSTSWYGNVKKYNICTDSSDGCSLGEILDINGASAIDSTDDKFKDTAQSVWSAAADGKATTQGGAGAEITDHTAQILYTDKNGSGFAAANTALSAAGFKLTSSTWNAANLSALRAGVCPTPSTSAGSECDDRMNWLLGKKIITDADNDVSANQRWAVNDVLHSSPSVITYGGSDTNADGEIDTFFDKIVYGTNDGTLHFVNGTTGAEEWRYLPSDFWAQQQTKYLNAQGDHVYGMDVTPTILAVDNDSDGKIETSDSDKVNIFMATRRGGNYMYALDVTANVTSTSGTVVPKFLWRIQGGTGSYARMGQTWSQPQLTKISISDGSGGTTTKDVLVFGGGYDTALDDKNVYDPSDNSNNDFLGNAFYIADTTDGSVIMDISGAGSGAEIIVSDMQYSIPSRVRLMDSNGDGLTDRLYVGDTGGQVWRVDLDPEIAAGNEADTVIAKLADVSTATNQRRFFEPPAVVQVRDTVYSDTSEYDYVLIGSGYRAHPLNTDVKDRFYAFRDRTITTFGLPDGDSDNVSEASDNYPQTGGTAYADGDLVDVTTSALDATDASDLAADGWFYDFTTAGSSAEKVLSAATVTSGAVVFTTFKPNTISITDPCQGGVGNATAYNLDILSANAALDWDGDGDIDLADRALALGGGIPSDVVPIFTEEGVVGIVGIEGGASQLGVLAGLPRFRTYWYEE